MTRERIEQLINGDQMGTHDLTLVDVCEIVHDEDLMHQVPVIVKIAIMWLMENQ